MWPIREIEITFFRDLPLPDAVAWFIFITAWYPYATLEIMFLLGCCVYLLARRKDLSVLIVLIVCLGTLALSLITSYYSASIYPHFDSSHAAKALTEMMFCLGKFLLFWGAVSLARKYMIKQNFSSKWKLMVYLAGFTVILYLYYAYGALCADGKFVFLDESGVYNTVLHFWESVLPEYMRNHFGD